MVDVTSRWLALTTTLARRHIFPPRVNTGVEPNFVLKLNLPPSPPGETTVHTPVLTLPLLEDTNISFGVWSTSSTTRSVWLWEKLKVCARSSGLPNA